MIVVELMGGMGNQMFQYALGRHLSIKYKTELKLDVGFLHDRTPREDFVYRSYDLDIFNVEASFAPSRFSKKYGVCKTPTNSYLDRVTGLNKFKYLKEEHFKFYPEMLESGDNVYLHGYWQTEQYFKQVEHIVRTDFTLKSLMSNKAVELANKIRSENAICLNVRRGDFVNHPILGSVGLEYYGAAVEHIKPRLVDPIIYVFSDEIDWCKANLNFTCPTHYVSHDYAGEKFRDYFELMTLCKHFVIPNSTFAWWAAWLCKNPDKSVVAPKMWFKDNSFSYQDIVPENWIKM